MMRYNPKEEKYAVNNKQTNKAIWWLEESKKKEGVELTPAGYWLEKKKKKKKEMKKNMMFFYPCFANFKFSILAYYYWSYNRIYN
jgi:hypothetical protein